MLLRCSQEVHSCIRSQVGSVIDLPPPSDVQECPGGEAAEGAESAYVPRLRKAGTEESALGVLEHDGILECTVSVAEALEDQMSTVKEPLDLSAFDTVQSLEVRVPGPSVLESLK